jgi:hypothetical protein
LGLGVVPVESLGDDETAAILQLIRLSNAQSLNFLEQGAMIDELKEKYNLSTGEIALQLERSPAWVSIRSGVIDEMSPAIKEAIFSGSFPVRSYLYTLRPFTRVNGFKKNELDVFVKSVSGKRLSTRDIETLAYGYFRGGRKFKEQIAGGNIDWTLRQMRQNKICPSEGENTFSESEREVLNNLELVQKYMERVIAGIRESGLNSPSFKATAHLVVEGILDRMDIFKKTIQEFYDQRKYESPLIWEEEKCGFNSLRGGEKKEGDRPVIENISEDGAENYQR